MQIMSEKRDGRNKRRKEESLGQERPVEDRGGRYVPQKTHTDVYMWKEAVELVFSQI